jgi:putative ABC transport system permease protein
VVSAVLLKPLAYRDPNRLVRITGDLRALEVADIGISVPELDDFRRLTDVFDDVSGIYPLSANLTGTEEPLRVETLLVSGNYFTMLGADAAIGRVFGPADETAGIAPLAVISDGLWRRAFGADPGAIGTRIRIDNDLYTVLGVLPARFRHPGRGIQTEVEVWAPTGFRASPFGPPSRGQYFMSGAVARLRAGVAPALARQRLETLARDLRGRFPDDYPARAAWAPRLVPLQDDLVGRARQALLILLGAVGFVLLIACVNVANFSLARASTRRREIAVRLALGAGRARIVRMLLTESLLLAFAGGALGLLVASWATDWLVALSPATIPRLNEVALDGRVALFTLIVSGATGVLFGLIPAFHAARGELQESLHEGRGATPPQGGSVRAMLIVAQFALALVLLIGAGLLGRSFVRLLQVDPGFDLSNGLVARMWLPQPNQPETGPYFGHASRLAFIRQLLERTAALPGVAQAAVATSVPLDGPAVAGIAGAIYSIEGRDADIAAIARASPTVVSPAYFKVMRIPIRSGRDFTEADNEQARPVVIVSETMARRYWPGEDPVGRRLRRDVPDSPWMTVIGVAGDVKTNGVDEDGQPILYASLLQRSSLQLTLVLRGRTGLAGLAAAIAREVKAIDPEIPVFGIRTMDDLMGDSVAHRRYAMLLLGLFAAAALSLAAIGIYGVMSYFVAERRREIGIRIALGAARQDVMRLVIGQGLALTAAGIALGLVAALALTRAMSAMLYGVSATDPITFVAITILLGLVATVACYLPARQALRVDPLRALRSE